MRDMDLFCDDQHTSTIDAIIEIAWRLSLPPFHNFVLFLLDKFTIDQSSEHKFDIISLYMIKYIHGPDKHCKMEGVICDVSIARRFVL